MFPSLCCRLLCDQRTLVAQVLRSSSRATAAKRRLHVSSLGRGLTRYDWKRLIVREANTQGTYNGPRILGRRTYVSVALPSVLVPPLVFTGLLLGLWAWKCLMFIVFQNKIIYMPSMPPFARSEKIADYEVSCRPVLWHEERIRSLDGTNIALAIGRMPESVSDHSVQTWSEMGPGQEADRKRRHVVICYFQGNGSSIPPRLSTLSKVLKSSHAKTAGRHQAVHYTIVAMSYRGYWTSSGRPSQRGIEQDAAATLRWVGNTYGRQSADLQLVLWGQSIGAGVASTAAATYLADTVVRYQPRIAGLVLETPFVSIRKMLAGLYPQRWLPYRYLWPFLRSHWDSERALQEIASSEAGRCTNVLLLPAAKDEVVPPGEADRLQRVCLECGLVTRRRDISGALHHEASGKGEGQEAVSRFVSDLNAQDSRRIFEPSSKYTQMAL